MICVSDHSGCIYNVDHNNGFIIKYLMLSRVIIDLPWRYWHHYITGSVIKLQNSSYDTTQTTIGVRGPFRHMEPFQYQYPMGRIIVNSCEVSMQRDRLFKLSYRFGIEQAAQQQQCCWNAFPMSKRSGNSKCKSREFETSRDVMIRRLTEYWNNHHTMARWNLINVIRFHWILLWGWNPIPAYPFLAYT